MRQTLQKFLKVLDGQPLASRGRRGQSLVEMALTTPLLVLMVLSLAEVGFLANNYMILLDAVRTGGRAGVNLNPTEKDWNFGDARNYQRLDCDEDLNWYSLILGSSKISAPGPYPNGSRQASDGPRAKNMQDYGYYNGPESSFGFFDEVACQVAYAMQPLVYNDDDATSKDDIVVSAVSYTHMDYNTGEAGALTVSSPNTSATGHYNDHPLNHGGTWITVTGRWPLENRFCAGSTNTGSWAFGDSRDPFDYLTNDINTKWHTGGSDSDGKDPDNGTDGDGNIMHEGVNFKPLGADNKFVSTTDYSDPANNYILDVAKAKDPDPSGPIPVKPGDNQVIRGFVMSAHNRNIVGTLGQPDADRCYGSAFRVQDIEDRLNVDGGFNKEAPNGGLVIVEIFWQHHPLFFGPIFQGFTGNRANDPVLHVWGFFPVPGAESTATPNS